PGRRTGPPARRAPPPAGERPGLTLRQRLPDGSHDRLLRRLPPDHRRDPRLDHLDPGRTPEDPRPAPRPQGAVGLVNDRSRDRSGPWLLAGITVFWGLNFLAIKYSVEEIPILTFRTICLSVGGFGLFAIARAAGLSLRVPRAERMPLAIASLGNITGWH